MTAAFSASSLVLTCALSSSIGLAQGITHPLPEIPQGTTTVRYVDQVSGLVFPTDVIAPRLCIRLVTH
ncbi:MAG: hypothetical protein ACI841_001008 [Planctomycetota bacterium]|jgi:hypothetical protein